MTNYLCISEKPTAAKRLAQALDEEGKPTKVQTTRQLKKVPIYESSRNGDKILVIPALGHLYSTVEDSGGGWHYPSFSYKWVPSYVANKKDNRTKPFVKAFKKYNEDVAEVIVATDYDLEGEVIGATIAKFACERELDTVKRMKFSTLTNEDIIAAFENRDPTVDIPLAEAGFTRHEIDWLYGINLTRALTLSIKYSTGRYKLITTGRVQGPTLRFVADRELKIQTFVPIPRWAIEGSIELDQGTVDLEYQHKFIPIRKEALKIKEDVESKEGVVTSIKSRKYTQKPPKPMSLGTLQSDAYRYFKYSPSKSLKIAEGLYLKALISYPRTSSEQFTKAINHKKIMKELTKMKKYKSRATQLLKKKTLKPTFGKKKDPAHPPIHPTGKSPGRLRNDERNILNLIICHYLALFGSNAIKNSLRLDIKVKDHVFYLRGKKIVKKGWLALYAPFGKMDEVELPDLEKGDKVTIHQVDIRQSYTQPPARYNANSLRKKMEEKGLGTKATRAGIIDKLYSRGYIEDKSINATDLGLAVYTTLEKNSPEILSPEMTKKLEEDMEKITTGDKDKATVLMSAIKDLKTILEHFHQKEEKIGKSLYEQVQNLKRRQRILGPCPVCEQGELIITRSRRTRKRFVGCTGFFKKVCSWSAPLPQSGYATPAKKECKHCGYPLIRIKRKGKKPYTLCANWLNCPGTPDDVLESYQKNKGKNIEKALEKKDEKEKEEDE
jgi:DNA topoisomerase-1